MSNGQSSSEGNDLSEGSRYTGRRVGNGKVLRRRSFLGHGAVS